MSYKTNHIVRKLNLDVEFQDHTNAFELKDSLSHVCRMELLPALETLFDQNTSSNRIIKTDKIVIDLGIIDKSNWKKKLVEQLVQRLSTYFMQRSSSTPSESYKNEGGPIESNSSVINVNVDENVIQSILYFLKTGLLPWYTIIRSRGEFNEQVNQLLLNPDRKLYKQIIITIRENTQALDRLINQMPAEFLDSILIMSGSPRENIKSIINTWQTIGDRIGVVHLSQNRIAYYAMLKSISQKISSSHSKLDIDLITTSIIESLDIDQQQKLIKSKSLLKDLKVNESESHVLKSVDNVLDKIKITESDKEKRNLVRLPQKEVSKEKIIEEIEAGLYINNAGLVILHPFLVRLFENVGYIEDKKWLSENHHQRAVLLTQYLITGEQEYPEFDLLLNKILVGYPLEDSLPADIVLSDFEIQEAEDVLKAVINHWKVLKNTSIPGLQSTFFQREGKLLYTEGRWMLHVEQKTVDILLNKLSWGIGIIKLPWMKDRMHVEWA